MSFYDVIITPDHSRPLCHSLPWSTPVVAYSRVEGVRAGFVCVTTSPAAHPPLSFSYQRGEQEASDVQLIITVHINLCFFIKI